MPKRPLKSLPPVAQRLREWRKKLALTQMALAERLNIDIGVLRKYENGINVPGGRVLASLGETGVNLNTMKQMTLAAMQGFEKHSRATRKAEFLARMEG
jgi:transcriptional regulator with XRE-family HTH domain